MNELIEKRDYYANELNILLREKETYIENELAKTRERLEVEFNAKKINSTKAIIDALSDVISLESQMTGFTPETEAFNKSVDFTEASVKALENEQLTAVPVNRREMFEKEFTVERR